MPIAKALAAAAVQRSTGAQAKSARRRRRPKPKVGRVRRAPAGGGGRGRGYGGGAFADAACRVAAAGGSPTLQAGAMPVMNLPSGFGWRLAGPARRPGGSGRSHHHLSGGALQLPRGTHRTMTTISVAVERRKMRVRASRFASKRS